MIEGKIEDIYAENAFVVVHDAEFSKLQNPKVGSELELNDHRAVIVGIAKVASVRPLRYCLPCTPPTSEPSQFHPQSPLHDFVCARRA